MWGLSCMGIYAFFYMWNLCGVVVFNEFMLDWRREVGSICPGHMCILLYVKLFCSQLKVQVQWCMTVGFGGPVCQSREIMTPCISPLWTKTGVLQKLLANGLHISLVTQWFSRDVCSIGGYIWSQCALHLERPNSDLGHQMPLPGGISYLSVHFIWKVDLVVHFIWKWPNSAFHHEMLLPRGYIWSLCSLNLKKWVHFRIYSCFTEVFSTKDQ